MSFRLIHCSDAHLGFEQYSSVVRLKDFAASLEEVARVAMEMDVDAVVDTGDSFNSPHPDPFSIMAYRRFVEKLHRHGIKFIGVIGNHNRHEIQDKIPGMSWFSAVSDFVIRPMNPESPVEIVSSKRKQSIWVVAADWMPSSDLPAFLSRIASNPDALFMHQSCEQFLPVVAKPELMLSQVDGIARYVGVGDVHVTKSVVTPRGTIVGSSGSTEMAKRDEDPLKYVMLVTFDCEDRAKPPTCERIQINTRGVITFPVITISEHIPPFIDSVARQLIPGAARQPMVVVAYSRSLHAEMAVAAERIKEMGVEILRLIPETEVKAEAEMQQILASGSILMEEIIAEMLKDNPEAAGLCLELWSSPANAPTIIESYISRIKEQYENQGIQSDEHIPAPPP